MKRFSLQRFDVVDVLGYFLIGFVVLIVAALIGFFVDAGFGSPLREVAVVSGHDYTPAHMSYSGKTPIYYPESWTLNVSNNEGSGSVGVDPDVYEKARDGQTIVVTGTRGKFSGNWYLSGVQLPVGGFRWISEN